MSPLQTRFPIHDRQSRPVLADGSAVAANVRGHVMLLGIAQSSFCVSIYRQQSLIQEVERLSGTL